MSRWWITAALAVHAAASALAQEPRVHARLAPEVARQVQAVLDSAERRGLPVEPLVQKALEGQSKGAPGPRIVAAVSGLFDALEQSRSALGSRTPSDELLAAAVLLRAGASTIQLSTLKAQAGSRSLTVPITVMTDLMTKGLSTQDALRHLDGFLKAKVSDRDLLAMRQRVEQELGRGVTIDRAIRDQANRFGAVPGEVP
jgi:hypothetical protein